jgi:hypothetical protein
VLSPAARGSRGPRTACDRPPTAMWPIRRRRSSLRSATIDRSTAGIPTWSGSRRFRRVPRGRTPIPRCRS